MEALQIGAVISVAEADGEGPPIGRLPRDHALRLEGMGIVVKPPRIGRVKRERATKLAPGFSQAAGLDEQAAEVGPRQVERRNDGDRAPQTADRRFPRLGAGLDVAEAVESDRIGRFEGKHRGEPDRSLKPVLVRRCAFGGLQKRRSGVRVGGLGHAPGLMP